MTFDPLFPFKIKDPDRIYPPVKYRVTLLIAAFFIFGILFLIILFTIFPFNSLTILITIGVLSSSMVIICLIIASNTNQVDVDDGVEFYKDHIIFRPHDARLSKIQRSYESLVSLHYFYRFRSTDRPPNKSKIRIFQFNDGTYIVAVIEFGDHNNIYVLPGNGFNRLRRHLKDILGSAFPEKVIIEKKPLEKRYYQLLEQYKSDDGPSILKRLWR